ncbi:class I glutamine amidotransferase-like protein [Eremomyces bilateralis CBS 781.70]|uniref:Class I glutamine amidotransferase-like protein n=1 Tax=Eremomyces bilateralis CBS 781.70 TaxID=1392243 RepID=A0A6G1FXU5_9PEZI|nr:class I glutamine amidotransferase-like protein [Eremomyces bilateralis CBS 781.70]KAF1810510.1 class I glutamine amidotransferase-like protein [Eremomyces bilateralis CBS 781.70]
MQPPIRIAILECDTPLEKTKAKYGGYGGVFKTLMVGGAKLRGLDPERDLEMTSWPVEKELQYPELEDIDAIMLTGSRYNAFDNTPWITSIVSYLRRVLEQDRVRIIGVCFGHQLVARALGTPIGRSDIGWEVSVCPVELSPEGQRIFGLSNLKIFQMHRDVVQEVPKGMTLLGSSARCDVQGFYQKNRVITVQGHPEFSKEIVSELLYARHESGIFDDDEYQDAMQRVGDQHDGVKIAAAFVSFLLEE